PKGLCVGGLGSPALLQTFGSGNAQFNTATPASFNFTTTYNQSNSAPTSDGHFSFINNLTGEYGTWHQAVDHTPDVTNGYMFLVNADQNPDEIYRSSINSLSIGTVYQFSAYAMNLLASPNEGVLPNITFEIRSPTNDLLASVSTGGIPETINSTWNQY
ncbi:unnamed protein product, partial [Didymodactylos carnosus]